MKHINIIFSLFILLLALLIVPASGFANAIVSDIKPPELGALLPIWSILPFAGILLSIALIPLIAPHFWHR